MNKLHRREEGSSLNMMRFSEDSETTQLSKVCFIVLRTSCTEGTRAAASKG